MDESEGPEPKPYLELSEELPENWRFQQGERQDLSSDGRAHIQPVGELLPPTVNPANPLLRELDIQRSRRSFFAQLRSVPRWVIVVMCVSMALILALMPQFLLIVAGVLRYLLLVIRAMALPVGAVLLTLWLIRLFYPRPPRA